MEVGVNAEAPVPIIKVLGAELDERAEFARMGTIRGVIVYTLVAVDTRPVPNVWPDPPLDVQLNC